MSISELTPSADLIVEGRLVRLKSYYWAEEDTIFTDYRLVPSRVIAEREARTSSSPGPTKPTVIALRGGEVVIEGTSVTLEDTTRGAVNENKRFLMFSETHERC